MTFPYLNQRISGGLYQALLEDPFYSTLESSVAGDAAIRKTAMVKYYDYSLQEGHTYGELVMPNGDDFGASIWAKPQTTEVSQAISQQKKRFLQTHLGTDGLERYEEITEFMAAKTRGVIPVGSWYLSILGVAPEFQGQGLGETLIQPILEKVDQAGACCYLETFTARNKRFYIRQGFFETISYLEPTTKARCWVMLREPPTASR